jgi:hypothetical protein
MLKAGLIGAGVGIFLAVGAAVLFPFICNPCAALLVGLGAGALAGIFDKPPTRNASGTEGAKAGAIATGGNLVGQMIGSVINGLLVGPEAVVELYRRWSIPEAANLVTPELYWITNLGVNCACALVGVAIGAGLGAVGGLLWYRLGAEEHP